MSQLNTARVWRAATFALAAGWVVMACGGGDEDTTAGATRVAVVSPQPVAVLGTAPVSPASLNEPCRPMPPTAPPARRDTTQLEREFVDALRSEMAMGVATGAGSVEVADPFEGQ